MKNNSGFTLIELLAVIVILAIIALIATPLILGVINDAKNDSAARGGESYLKSVELAITKSQMEAGGTIDGTWTTSANGEEIWLGVTKPTDTKEVLKVEFKGKGPDKAATIIFAGGKVTSVTDMKIDGVDLTYADGSFKADK